MMHLATLNLFRQGDGSLQITVAEGNGAMEEFNAGKIDRSWLIVRDHTGDAMQLPKDAKPTDYIEEMIVEAGENMRQRREP